LRLEGRSEGSDLGSLTVQGEDRIRIEYERPRLDLDRDLRPRQAPGLDWENTWESVDLFSRLMESTAFSDCPYLGRPWLTQFSPEEVARFAPRVSTEGPWQLTVVDSRGVAVRSFSGQGEMPEAILWDGRDMDGGPVTPGLTYSFRMELRDRAGNVRSYTGEGFDLPPFLLRERDGFCLVFAGECLETDREGEASGSRGESLLREAASWLNQTAEPAGRIEIRTQARSEAQAAALSQRVSAALVPLLAGDPKRIACLPAEKEDAPDHGTVLIRALR
jgi:hypothetical protein